MALPPAPAPLAYSPAPADVAGVLAGRIGAFLVDFVVIGFLVLVFSAVVMVLGVFTFGLAWLLMPALVPLVALVYNGITVSGPRRGTWGMRTFGIEMRMAESGGPVPFVVAAVHAIFFYVSVTFLTPIVLLFGLFRADRRLLHDLFAGTIALRRLP